MVERLNLDGGTLNLDWGKLTLDGGTRPPYNLSTGYIYENRKRYRTYKELKFIFDSDLTKTQNAYSKANHKPNPNPNLDP